MQCLRDLEVIAELGSTKEPAVIKKRNRKFMFYDVLRNEPHKCGCIPLTAIMWHITLFSSPTVCEESSLIVLGTTARECELAINVHFYCVT